MRYENVVTGGAGFMGSHLVDALVQAGGRVRVVDDFSSGNPRNLHHFCNDDRVEIIKGDVADKALMVEALEGADRVFHLAGLADIVPSIDQPDPYYHSNVTGTFSVLEAARARAVKRFVYAASSTCYGIPEVYPTPEEAKPDPRYPYALTKWLGEIMVLHWARVYGMSALSLRFFNVYGPRARTSGAYGAVFGVFLAQLLAGKPLTIVGDGEQSRDFTFVSDAVDALVVAANSDRVGEVYNVGTGRAVKINELVALLGATETVNIPKRPGEPDCTLASTAKISAHLGWTPKVFIEDGTSIMLENIEYWRDAPLWTPDSIAEANKGWFTYLT